MRRTIHSLFLICIEIRRMHYDAESPNVDSPNADSPNVALANADSLNTESSNANSLNAD